MGEGRGVRIFGISDLHLGGAEVEERGKFGKGWGDHRATIEENWRRVVGADDLVLMPGDLSSARTHREVQADLAWLERLPGCKVFSAGNHDRWFNRVEAIRPLLRRSQRAVGGDAIGCKGVVVCGTRGAELDAGVGERDKELAALDRALELAVGLRAGDMPLYVLWHYPPFDAHGEAGPVVGRLEAAGVTGCVYGHVHRLGDWSAMAQGVIRGVRYACVAADAVGFCPIRVG